MPSETIYSSSPVNVRVAWGTNREGVVQVATLAASQEYTGEATDRLLGVVNEWLKTAEMPLIDIKALREKLAGELEFEGWYAQLDDWAAVNMLIKVLKRSRDQSFGTPE